MKIDFTQAQLEALLGACASRSTELEDRLDDADCGNRAQDVGEMRALQNAWTKIARVRNRRSARRPVTA